MINKLNEIVEVKYGNEIYKTWKVEFIKPLITKFLKEKYSDSLIVSELSKIDVIIFDNISNEIIPVEIQKTIIQSNGFGHTKFESSIRTQLDINIENHGKCWFFFDSEYLRYLQYGNIGKSTSINMIWLVKLMKEETLKVFTIKYDGTVKELTTKDFDFLKKVSQTCVIGYDNDERILDRNKLKIYKNVVKGYNFFQEEIDLFYKEFVNSDTQHATPFFIKNENERCKLYGNILHSIGSISLINDTLNMNVYDKTNKNKQYLNCIGIFDIVGTYGSGNLIRFVDKFDICKYFPGYIRNKEQWESYRNTNITHETFILITNGSLKHNKSLMNY